MELIPITFKKVMQSRAYTCLILGTDKKRFAIYTDSMVGKNLQTHLSDELPPRPYTHDLMSLIFKGLGVRIKQVVINKRDDTIYFARIFLEQDINDQIQLLEIDARPSDCITLAFLHNVPVYCNREVLEKAIAVEE